MKSFNALIKFFLNVKISYWAIRLLLHFILNSKMYSNVIHKGTAHSSFKMAGLLSCLASFVCFIIIVEFANTQEYYNFTGNQYLTHLCKSFGRNVPTNETECQEVFNDIVTRYCITREDLLHKLRQNKMPSTEAKWQILFNLLSLQFNDAERLLRDVELPFFPTNEYEWIKVKNFIKSLEINIVDPQFKRQIQEILQRQLKNDTECFNVFLELAVLYPSIPKDKKTAIVEYYGVKQANDYKDLFFYLADRCASIEKDKKSIEEDMKKIEEDMKKIEEKNERLLNDRNFYISLLDLTQSIYALFEERWPLWAPYRAPNTRTFSVHEWETLFLNLEDERIHQMKTILAHYNISEHDFIERASSFMSQPSNDIAYPIAKPHEKNETYRNFLKFITQSSLKIIIQLLIFPDDITTPSPLSKIINDVLEVSKGIRNEKYRIFKVANYPEDYDNDMLKQEFDRFTRRYKELYPSSPYQGPLITFKGIKNGYALFNNFTEAYITWTKKDWLSFSDDPKQSIAIESINNTALDQDVNTVLLEVGQSDQLEEVISTVGDVNQNVNLQKRFQFKNTLVCEFKNGVSALMAYLRYEKMNIKNVIKLSCGNKVPQGSVPVTTVSKNVQTFKRT